MKEIIKLENVIKLYGQRRALNGVDLIIEAGERVCIRGAAGSGKSTLVKLIAGMERPSAGEIHVLGKAVHDMDTETAAEFRNRNIGVVLREPCLLRELSLAENVALPLTARGTAANKREKAAREQLKALGMPYAAHTMSEKVSFYEAQLVSLARALTAQPKILLLDDAAAGLSESETQQLKGILVTLSKFGDFTVISFSGGGDILGADRSFVLEQGKLKEDKG